MGCTQVCKNTTSRASQNCPLGGELTTGTQYPDAYIHIDDITYYIKYAIDGITRTDTEELKTFVSIAQHGGKAVGFHLKIDRYAVMKIERIITSLRKRNVQ